MAAIAALLILLVGCGSNAPSALGEAFVAPANLNLHATLAQKSNTVAVLKHGDHLRIVDVKRRYVRVITDKGVEGWLDSRQLLSREQMDQLRDATANEQLLTPQGSATVFDVLNVHIDPDRHSPAFTQIPAGGSVTVLAHKATPKTAGPAPLGNTFSLMKPQTPVSQQRRAHQRKTAKAVAQRPPMPLPPEPPDDWQELSSERVAGATTADLKKQEQAAKEAKEKAVPEKPVILEDWSLVRTKDKKVGWVLSRNLYMSIPDEVAQYAEGQRISSFFDLGQVNDEVKGVKHNWLWTTSSHAQPFDFDRFRIFYWNRRRHRYETAYREKGLIGYFPVEVEKPNSDERGRYFSLITQDETGQYTKKRYNFDGAQVHLSSTEIYHPAENAGPTKVSGIELEKMEAKRPQPSWWRRQMNRISHLIGK